MSLVFEPSAAEQDRGAELLRLGCDGGDPQGCAHLAYLYQNGISVEQDETTARRLNDHACRGGYRPACTASQ